MLRREVLRAWTTIPLWGWFRRWSLLTTGGAATDVPNAADSYHEAFAWAKGLRPEESAWLRNGSSIAIDDHRVGTLINRARPALRAIREAVTFDRCRWETEIVTNDDLGKEHLDVSNLNIIQAACLSARLHANLGRARDALDDVFAALSLAHRTGTGGFLFARVLECGGEVPAFKTLARILPGLGRAGLDDLSRRLDALLPPEPASAAIEPESKFILGSIRTKLQAIGTMVEDDEWTGLGLVEVEAAELKRLTGGDREKLLRHLEATVPVFAELARRLDLPRPGCREALDEFAKSELATHPIAAGVTENAWGVRHVVDRMKALRSILHAAVVLFRDGEAAFKAESDPFGTGGFRLQHRVNGYSIRSALDDQGRPEVSLEIGGAA